MTDSNQYVNVETAVELARRLLAVYPERERNPEYADRAYLDGATIAEALLAVRQRSTEAAAPFDVKKARKLAYEWVNEDDHEGLLASTLREALNEIVLLREQLAAVPKQ